MKEENIKGEYQRKVDKSLIPTCNIMGVNIAAINMNWLLKYLDIIPLFGKYENRKFINFALSQSAVPARDSSQESYQY